MSFLFFGGKQKKKNANVFRRRALRLEELETRQLLSVSTVDLAEDPGSNTFLQAAVGVQALPTPTFNAPTIGSTSVTMSWNNIAQSSGYVLQWRLSTNQVVQGTQTLSGNTTTSYVVSGLSPATGYTFNVKATSDNPAYTDSAWSFDWLLTTNSTGYTPGDDSPVAPVLYTDAVSSTTATFHWSAVSGATSYVLQYYAKHPVETEPVELPFSKAGSHTVSGLEKGTQYVFTLWGIKADGSETAHSFPVYVTTNSAGITIPLQIDSPSLQILKTTGDSTVSVSWSNVEGAGSYLLEYSTNSAFTSGTVVSQSYNVSNTPVTIEGLQAKTTYYFRVKAIPENVGTFDSYWSQWLSTTTWALDQNETTIWVTSAKDNQTLNGDLGGITLREAIDQASSINNSVIGFDDSLKGQTIYLVAPLEIASSRTVTINATNLWDEMIDRPGITISGQNECRVFVTGQSSVVTLAGLKITRGNANDGNGGGIYNGGNLCVLDSFICGNQAAYGGGIFSGDGGMLSMNNSRVSGNSAATDSMGGGLYLASTNAQIDNVEISGNSQGGIRVSSDAKEITFNQCTIAANINTGKAGGVYVDKSSKLDLVFNNTIIASNQTTNPDGEDTDPDLDSDTSNAYTLNSCLVGTNPLFVDFRPYTEWNSTLWESWNLALTGMSPAVDSGNNSSVPLNLNVDLGNIPRITGHSVDIGAYEYFLPTIASRGELSTTQGCSLMLDASAYCSSPGMAPGLVYAWDINGDGFADHYGRQVRLSPQEVIWQGAAFNISLVVKNGDNTISNPSVIRVDVLPIGASAEATQSTIAVDESSRIAKYSIKTSTADNTPVANWIVDWGDGQQSTIRRVAHSLTVCHYYGTNGAFTARAQMIDANSNGEGVWYELGTTFVGAPNTQAVFANDDSILPEMVLFDDHIPDEPETPEFDLGVQTRFTAEEELINILALDQQKKTRAIPGILP